MAIRIGGGVLPRPFRNPGATALKIVKQSSTLPVGPGGGPGPKRPRTKKPAAPSKGGGMTAEQRAANERAAAMTAAGNRFRDAAGNLDPQIAALRYALDTSFRQALDQNLTDISGLTDEQLEMLKKQASQRGLDFLESGKTTALSQTAQAEDSMTNFVRERQDTMASLLEQGAGQTDQLRALMSAARNWRANQQEGNRAYFDSIQSLNQGITDLNMDTQTGLANIFTQGESERERAWQDYYNRRSETLTQIGNLYQQQADYLDQAKEQKVGGGGGEKKTAAGTAFMDASKEAGMSYKKQGLPDWIKSYSGVERVQSQVTNTNLAASPTIKAPKGPKGAQLRRWA